MSAGTAVSPSESEVAHEFDRIRLSKRFRRSGTSLKLLEFLLQKSLKGEVSNEREVGVELYNRPENWIPADDNIVRMGRFNLQGLLAEYYVSEGVDDIVILDTPNGTVYRASWCYNPRSRALGHSIEGLNATRHMFLSCGAPLVERMENGKVTWEVVGEYARPQHYFDKALAYEDRNRLAVSGKLEATLTFALFRGYLRHTLMTVEDGLKEWGKDLPWRGNVVRACAEACNRKWWRAGFVFSNAREQCPAEEMDDVWSLLLILGSDQKEGLRIGQVKQGEKDGLEETQYGLTLYMARQFEDAMDELMHAEEVSARARVANFMAKFLRGCVYLAQGKAENAEKLFRSCLDKWDIRGFLVISLMAAGKKEEAIVCARCVRDDGMASGFQRALVEMALLNDTDAMKSLSQAYADGDPWVWFAPYWPVLDPLKHNQDFTRLLEDMNKTRLGTLWELSDL